MYMSVVDRNTPTVDFFNQYNMTNMGFVKRLSNAGFDTVWSVATIHQPIKIARALGIPSDEMVKMVHMAQKKTAMVIKRKELRLPEGVPLWFDIETNLRWNRIWLIGVLDEADNHVYQFFAKDWNEYDMMLEFDAFLKARPNRPLLYYSCNNFDIRVTRNVARRLGMDDHAIFTQPEMDICRPLRDAFFIPTTNRKLKTIARFLGFDMTLEDRDDYMDGKECAMHYEEHIKYGTPLDPNVFTYNANDVKMLPFILRRLEELSIRTNGY